ncbi:hypothetical protein ACO2Q0_14750 [Phenylobacterium sp. VNQ135]|uniref:hypothetical protein n=1 Tax=Phenylobacterium sp. VNQ135 TaxID=3400922 RepID=UPI003C08D6F7
MLHHAVVIQIEGSSYRLREHAELMPEHARSKASIALPAVAPARRRRWARPSWPSPVAFHSPGAVGLGVADGRARGPSKRAKKSKVAARPTPSAFWVTVRDRLGARSGSPRGPRRGEHPAA